MISDVVATMLAQNKEISTRVRGVYSGRVPRPGADSYPAIVIRSLSHTTLPVLDGKPPMDERIEEVDIIHTDDETSYVQLQAIGDAAREALEGFVGRVGDVTVCGVTLLSDETTFQPPSDGGSSWTAQRSMDFKLLATNRVRGRK